MITLPLLLKLPLSQLLLPFGQSFYFKFFKFCLTSINLWSNFPENILFMPGLVLQIPTWIYYTKCRDGCVGSYSHCLVVTNYWNVASVVLFNGYHFERYSSEQAELAPLFCSRGLLIILIGYIIGSGTTPRCY